MPVYVVERYLPGMTARQLAALQRAVLKSSRSFAADGQAVRYLRSIFLPGESRCLCLFEAEDADLAREVNDAANFTYTRILNAMDLTMDEGVPPWSSRHSKDAHGRRSSAL